MKHGLIKVAAATPRIRVADPAHNVAELLRLTREAEKLRAHLLVFPELCLTGYTAADLFHSAPLLSGAEEALATYLQNTKETDLVAVIGMPVVFRDKLYNCAAVCHRGTVLGVVPKSHLPNYGEFYEIRHFQPASEALGEETVSLCGMTVPFGTSLLFCCREVSAFRIGVEICEDLWGAVPPSTYHTAAGATIICNPSASNDTVGKDEYRRQLVSMQSARTLCAYVYASAGEGESTTDVVFGGHDLIAENGTVLAEKKPFDGSTDLICTEVDAERLCHERMRMNTHPNLSFGTYREIAFSCPVTETELTRFVDPHPFVPDDREERSRRCETILSIQATGLKTRIERAFAKKLVIGISGGLDSTLALLVSARAMDALGRSRKDIVTVTMPCFGTTKRTKTNATVLCEELGTDFRTVDIFDAVNLHFRDIGHNPEDHNVTYENCQARERTQILMDIANDCGGMVVGTGDLSELALGFATYNGDHMSMYGVNCSVPKTLVRHIVAYCADESERRGDPRLAAALRDVLETPVSPELLPADASGEIAQKTEDLVGPYELHDFFLYYMIRFGFSPAKLYRLAVYALGNTYSPETIRKWLKLFIRRFFSQQFKRSCVPDGPKVGSIALSPRGDWRMPSDASAALWLAEAEKL